MNLPAVLLLASFSAAASIPVSRTDTIPQNNIRWVDCAENVPQSDDTFNASAVDLSSLPSNLHCGQLDVPMDYSKPFCVDTNMITLGLAVVRAEESKGALFFNPGGSDPGVIVAWEVALNLTNAFDGLEELDLVVTDVRGTFSSNPLNVSLDTFAGLGGPYPTNQSEYDAVKNASATAIQSWIDNSSPPGILKHVGTREVIQDYESIRKALGYEKINWLGGSQGGFRGAAYADAFPERVMNFALDASAIHGRSVYDQTLDQVAAFSRLMLRADAYCQNNASCPFHSQGRGSVPAAFKEIVETAKETPYFIPACSNSTTCSPYISDLDIRSAMQGMLGASPDFPVILNTINSTLVGDASGFVSPPLALGGVVAMPLLCNDYDYPRTFEYFNKSLTDGMKIDTSGIGLNLVYQIQLWCSAWPFEVPKSERITTNQTMLMITADFDGSAPTEWATFAFETAPNSALVVRHGDNHVSFPVLFDQPSTKITKDFLLTGILPTAQNTSQVTVYTPGMKRGPILNPYEVPTGPKAGDVDSGVLVQIPF